MRGQTERNNNMASTTMPRRIVLINTTNPALLHHQFQPSFFASFVHFLKRPQSRPFILFIFLVFAWISYRIHRASRFPPTILPEWSTDSDMRANLVRFSSFTPSQIAKDSRGWLLDPVFLALSSSIPGGAVTCASLHVGEIRPGRLRGNHRHHDCNETFVIWGAATKFRLENIEVADHGYAEVTIGKDEIAVATSPSHKAHALVNIDPIRSTFFIGCQDSIISYNASSSDFNVWKDL
ncbi:hypothetical protein RIF29_05340 [Crotalaria pallida]|uniref:Uncharacterized protein n=1 Tax=Crotalaria pallida TaxID=3830 RepID=A0AAN9J250_CROPI